MDRDSLADVFDIPLCAHPTTVFFHPLLVRHWNRRPRSPQRVGETQLDILGARQSSLILDRIVQTPAMTSSSEASASIKRECNP